MAEARDTIHLNTDKTERLRFIVDEYADMPDDEGSPYSILVYQPWSYRAEVTEMNASLSHASRELLMSTQHLMSHYMTLGKSWETVSRFYRIFYGVEIAVSHHTGYSQGDEWALISFDTPEWRKLTGVSDSVTITECQNTEIADWARGDCFGVVHEELVSTCNNPDHGEWQEIDGYGSLWGFYGSPWDADTLDYVADAMGVELEG